MAAKAATQPKGGPPDLVARVILEAGVLLGSCQGDLGQACSEAHLARVPSVCLPLEGGSRCKGGKRALPTTLAMSLGLSDFVTIETQFPKANVRSHTLCDSSSPPSNPLPSPTPTIPPSHKLPLSLTPNYLTHCTRICTIVVGELQSCARHGPKETVSLVRPCAPP